ncbi:MAG: toxin TcdB middle/N-terminal domain-containing protein, partial [Verrucomicrobiota bacterium]
MPQLLFVNEVTRDGIIFSFGDKPADMLTGVTNGLGATTTVAYKPLTDESIYTKGTGATYPIQDVQSAMYVPAEVCKDDGLGELYKTEYKYAGARADTSGRGFLGFETFTSCDVQNNITKVDVLAQDFPRTGMVLESSTYYDLQTGVNGELTSGQILARTRNYTYFDHVQGGTVFPFVARSVEKKWELGDVGALTVNEDLNPTDATSHYAEITTDNLFDVEDSATYWYGISGRTDGDSNEVLPEVDDDGTVITYDYPNSIIEGNITRIKISYGNDGDSGYTATDASYDAYAGTQETINTYYYGSSGFFDITNHVPSDTVPYLIGRLKDATVISTTADDTGEPRESSFTYDPGTGLLLTETIEPNATGDKAYLKLTTTHLRDDYGNIYKTTETPGLGTERTVVEHTNIEEGNKRTYTASKNADGDEETRAYDFRFGAVSSLTGPNKRTTSWVYDALGRKKREVRSNNTATVTDYNFDTSVMVTTTDHNATPAKTYNHTSAYKVTEQVVDAADDTVIAPSATAYYDKLGREIRVQSEVWLGDSGDDTGYVTVNKDTGYNSLGQVTCVTEPYDSTGAAAYYTKSYYDDLGRMVRAVTPAGTVTTTDYDKLSVTVTRNAVSSNPATNENQTVTTYKNLRGQDIKITNGESDLDIDNTVVFKYDASGNLLESYAPSTASTKVVMTYDLRGNKLTMIDPDMGTWVYQYDSYGRLIKQTDAKGQVTTMDYDLLDRMTQRTTDADDTTNAQTSNWYYTSNADVGDYDEVGALSLEVAHDSSGNEVSRRAYYYDEKGRLFVTLDKVLVEGGRYKYFYTQSRFDDYGRPTHAASFWRPIELEASEFNLHYGWSSFVQKTTYNQKGFVLKVEDTGQTDGGTPRTLWSAPKYNIYGQLEEYTMGGRVVVAQVYDDLDHTLEQITASNDTVNYQHMTFDFDELGNVVSRADNRRNLSESFTYDRINRLSSNKVEKNGSE